MPKWLGELVPIALLLALIAVVVARLPKVELGHSDAYRRRRALNWLPLGLTYAFLYMGRYNLTAFKDGGSLTREQFGDIFAVGAAVYGVSFLLNGPLTDKLGGRRTILISAFGSAMANLVMGVVVLGGYGIEQPVLVFSILYGVNMYFQSFGAVSIVKVNSAWFHVRERGVFAGIFGILISLGIYFAFDWGHRIVMALPHQWVFFIPAAILLLFFAIDLKLVRDTPSDAGHTDFDTGDASSGDDGPPLPVGALFKRLLTNPVILTIAMIEFCSGFLRNAIMHWYRDFAKGLSLVDQFVYENWGMLLCMAGITGGMLAGVISDRVFQSRRGPVAALLYGIMLVGGLVMIPLVSAPLSIGWIVVVMSMAIIGVHGMLSGVASQDFGGKKNAGTAVGIIDGFVYGGTALQSVVLGHLLPARGTPEAAQIESWTVWPYTMLPAAGVGLILAVLVWHARPQPIKKR
ncbi:MFS transporter [Haliangium sp.]|uniref:MFS transporter n=1 Tax=Haliangium sp. TaxID=2663208 RepID=UPI003D0C91E7